jgi:peroxiredoxin
MTQLRQDYTLFQERDAIVVAIGPENRETFAKYWRDHDIPFIGIPDPQHKIADLYGQEVSLVKLGRMPAQMIIDKQGILRYVHYGNSMKDIPENKEILELLDDIQADAR